GSSGPSGKTDRTIVGDHFPPVRNLAPDRLTNAGLIGLGSSEGRTRRGQAGDGPGFTARGAPGSYPSDPGRVGSSSFRPVPRTVRSLIVLSGRRSGAFKEYPSRCLTTMQW